MKNTVFNSFNEYITESIDLSEKIIKRKKKLFSYYMNDELYAMDDVITISSDTIYSFFNDNDEIDNSSTLNLLKNIKIYEEHLNINPIDAVNISKELRVLLNLIADKKFPNSNVEEEFNQAIKIMQKYTSKKYMESIKVIYDYNDYNNLALKELSIKTNIPPKNLSMIFTIKYLYVLAILSNKKAKNKIKIIKI